MTAERVRLISELTDDLIRHAGTVRDHSEQMVRALEDAISSVTGKLGEPALTDPFPLDPGPPLLRSAAAAAQPAGRAAAAATPSAREYETSWPQQPGPATAAAARPEPPPTSRRYEPPPAYEPPATPPGPSRRRRLRPDVVSPSAPVSQEALLHATRLAVAGNDRETIAPALRDRVRRRGSRPGRGPGPRRGLSRAQPSRGTPAETGLS